MTSGVTIFSRINTAILSSTFTSKSTCQTRVAREWHGANPNPLGLAGLPDQRQSGQKSDPRIMGSR
jgi:hypothetical protein